MRRVVRTTRASHFQQRLHAPAPAGSLCRRESGGAMKMGGIFRSRGRWRTGRCAPWGRGRFGGGADRMNGCNVERRSSMVPWACGSNCTIVDRHRARPVVWPTLPWRGLRAHESPGPRGGGCRIHDPCGRSRIETVLELRRPRPLGGVRHDSLRPRALPNSSPFAKRMRFMGWHGARGPKAKLVLELDRADRGEPISFGSRVRFAVAVWY